MQYKLLHELNESKKDSKIRALTWSPNGKYFALATNENKIVVHDENGAEKDKFIAKKSADEKTKSTTVAIAFSPDGTLLAVAHSDKTINVFRLGLFSKEKNTKVSSFSSSGIVTCLVWPIFSPEQFVFGTDDGQVRVGNLKTNDTASVAQERTPVVALDTNKIGNTDVVVAFQDGTLRLISLAGTTKAEAALVKHPETPQSMCWTAHGIFVSSGGTACAVYDPYTGKRSSIIDVKVNRDFEDDEEEITNVSSTVDGRSVAVATVDHLRFYEFSRASAGFEPKGSQFVLNLGAVSILTFSPESSRKVALATSSGSAFLLEAASRKLKYKDNYEFENLFSKSVLITWLKTNGKLELKSNYGRIEKLDIYRDKFLVARTAESLLLGDLEAKKLSELMWPFSLTNKESFIFDYPQVCLASIIGELFIIEYGKNQPLYSCKTQYMKQTLLSVLPDIHKLAYLVDWRTVCVVDWKINAEIATISHSSNIAWLELSPVSASHILFLDKRRNLILYNLEKRQKHTIASNVTFVQWVPSADVIVAQSGRNLCVWYSIDVPEQRTIESIDNGKIDSVRRTSEGDTIAVVDMGAQFADYKLDSAIISFATAKPNTNEDIDSSIKLLQEMPLTPETEAKWRMLCATSLENFNLTAAEQCLAAVQDVARARYIHNINDMARKIAIESDFKNDPMQHFRIRAKLAIFNGDYRLAESIYLAHGATAEAIKMYQEIHDWNGSIRVAEKKNYPDLLALKRNYLSWLLDTEQFDEAAERKLEDGDEKDAIELFLKGQRPSKAADIFLVKSPGLLKQNPKLGETTAICLYQKGLYEKAGLLYESLGKKDDALAAFKKGNCYSNALTLARTFLNDSQVKALEASFSSKIVSF